MDKKLVVITGATSGIGLQIAKRFNEAGFSLLLLGRNEEKLSELKLNNTLVKNVDVRDIDAMKSAIALAEESFGPVDGLLNIAGLMLLGDIADQDPTEWKTMIDVNVLGVLNGMQAVIPKMKERKQGTIINMSSIAGFKPFPNHAAYVGSKFAVHGLTDNVREELAPFNIRVITIAPGAVDTSLLSHTSSKQIKDDYEKWKKEMGVILKPDDVAKTILFAYQQPQHVSLREIVIATTKQVP